MIAGLKRLWSITAVRLSLVYFLLFGALAVVIVFYMTFVTVDLISSKTRSTIKEEADQVMQAYGRGNLNRLIRVLEIKARSPNANIYVVMNHDGGIIAGNVLDIAKRVKNKVGWTYRPFRYYRFDEDNNKANDDGSSMEERHDRDQARLAVAEIIELKGGLRLLIGRDVSDHDRIGQVVRRVLLFTFVAMLVVAVLAWVLVGRRGLKRLQLIHQSTERIMAGDREERLPVIGNNDEFDRLSKRLNSMLERIFKLDEGLKQVSDNIAHDLRTPLTRLRNKAEEALSAGKSDEGYRQTLEEILSDSENVIRTFDALLMISRVESGSAAARLAEVNLSEIVEEVCELYEPVSEDEGFAFKVNVDKDITILGNRELLGQALSNLVDNAIKYAGSAENPSITISLTKSDETAVLLVCDNGPGIASEERERVFERFARLDQSRNKPGNGLGLSLVQAVVSMHDGEIKLGDEKPGLRVEARLPILG